MERFSLRSTLTHHPQIFSQFRSSSVDRFIYIVLIILFALYDRETAWEHFWKKQLFKTGIAYVLSKGHSPSGMGCSSMGPTCGATGPARSLLQHGVSVDCSVSSSPWSSMGCRGTACVTRVFSCRAIYFST